MYWSSNHWQYLISVLLSIPEYTVKQQTDDGKCNPNENGNVVDDVEWGKEGCDEHYRSTIGWKST